MAEQEVASPPITTPSTELIADFAAARRQWRNGDLTASLRSYRQLLASGEVSADCLLDLAQVELASGEAAAAGETLRRLLTLDQGEPLKTRATLLLATAELALGDWQEALGLVDVETAPDGLADLVVLRRAEAAAEGGHLDRARNELGREGLRSSTNRLILERAGQLAEITGDYGLAAELYARGAGYFGWTAERSRLMQASGAAFARAGRVGEAIEQYRRLVEAYSWTKAAEDGLAELERLDGATPYHRGLIAMATRRDEEAVAALSEAAAEGAYTAAAARQLRQLEESMAWRTAVDDATADAFRSFQSRYPDGVFAADARFQEGLAHYQAGLFEEALGVWDKAVALAGGDERARLHLWAGKALFQLGRDADSRARLRAAAETQPAGYYALRARDLLAGIGGWPPTPSQSHNGIGGWPKAQVDLGASDQTGLSAVGDSERAEVERWLDDWSGPAATTDNAMGTRIQRGLGLLALGYRAEAAAELNAVIAESQDARGLYRLAELLVEQELWSPASRAATRLIALSREKTGEVPLAIQRLAYPPAYWDLVSVEAERHNLDPLLLLALIRQESNYDPFAISIASARGLTQVVPSTGEGIATALGWSAFTTDDLYRPMIAVEFGAWYLANQLSRFDGDPFQALAAYNAGAGPVAGWLAPDLDLFVERIDYSETKNYVRQVYLHHAVYRALFGR